MPCAYTGARLGERWWGACLDSTSKCNADQFRGERGYWPGTGPFPDEKTAFDFVNERNALIGVTPYQREAMLNGSLWGWDVPGADPDNSIVKLSADSKKGT